MNVLNGVYEIHQLFPDTVVQRVGLLLLVIVICISIGFISIYFTFPMLQLIILSLKP